MIIHVTGRQADCLIVETSASEGLLSPVVLRPDSIKTVLGVLGKTGPNISEIVSNSDFSWSTSERGLVNGVKQWIEIVVGAAWWRSSKDQVGEVAEVAVSPGWVTISDTLLNSHDAGACVQTFVEVSPVALVMHLSKFKDTCLIVSVTNEVAALALISIKPEAIGSSA